ncbi:MAG: DUF362 domain-containing protein [Syntrophobacteraceae bacterium]
MDEKREKSGCPKLSRLECPLTRREFLSTASKLAAGSFLFAAGVSPRTAAGHTLQLPSWTSSTAVSDIFVVKDIPAPVYSLAGGSLPSGPVDTILRDAGIEALVSLMDRQGTPFFRTSGSPLGIVPRDSVVVIKSNEQWVGEGTGSGSGRLGTSTDLLKGLIWRILNHPEGFTGEVVVAENVQPIGVSDFATRTPSNAQDQNQTLADVITVFQGMGRPVSLKNWTTLNDNLLPGGNYGSGAASSEYSNGNTNSGYVLLNDNTPGVTLTNGYSYPKFRTAGGRYISMRHGLWDGTSYQPDRLVFINMPVLKKHGMAGATAAWKNLIGFVNCDGMEGGRFDSWDAMHTWFWSLGDPSNVYGLIGRQISLIRAPDLNIVDAVWVANISNYDSSSAVRWNVVLGSRDPFAVDWYASEYVLRPVVLDCENDSSLARAGTFRTASLVNQKAAMSTWSGTYPHVDFVEGHSGSTPLNSEKNQMNVYLASASTQPGKGAVPAINTLLLD